MINYIRDGSLLPLPPAKPAGLPLTLSDFQRARNILRERSETRTTANASDFRTPSDGLDAQSGF